MKTVILFENPRKERLSIDFRRKNLGDPIVALPFRGGTSTDYGVYNTVLKNDPTSRLAHDAGL